MLLLRDDHADDDDADASRSVAIMGSRRSILLPAAGLLLIVGLLGEVVFNEL